MVARSRGIKFVKALPARQGDVAAIAPLHPVARANAVLQEVAEAFGFEEVAEYIEATLIHREKILERLKQ